LYGATPKKGFTDRLVLTFQSATNEHFTVLKNHYIHNGGILIKERNKMFTIQYIRGEVAGTFIPADETIEVKVDFR
jgi:hypothetical protein